MKNFHYKNGKLFWNEISIKQLLKRVDTPFYLYNYHQLTYLLNKFKNAFSDHPPLICYALKANSNGALLTVLAKEGVGADVVSGGELKRALQAGISSNKIVFAGVGKKKNEISEALDKHILALNVESISELSVIAQIAQEKETTAPISLRVNPDINPRTHPYISTGLRENKFGIGFPEAKRGYERAKKHRYLNPIGIHAHIGSQITEQKPFEDALSKIVSFVEKLSHQGIHLRFIDIGGGLGIPYKRNEPYLDIETYAQLIQASVNQLESTPQVIIEPGRSIMGPAGALIVKVLYVKEKNEKVFIIVDAGMNDFIRPSLYGAWHEILPVTSDKKRGEVIADVVGPICESSDFFAKDRQLPVVEAGEALAILDTGAYGYSMTSNYNSRRRPPEILATENEHYVIRKREKMADITKAALLIIHK